MMLMVSLLNILKIRGKVKVRLEDLDFKNIIEVHNKVVSSGYHNYDGCRIPVKSGINVDFFSKKLVRL
jgi:hypothetical protein